MENEAFAGGGYEVKILLLLSKMAKCCKLMGNDGAERKTDARESGSD